MNQKQLAQFLNLSTATVSRSLRNDPAIAPATRARVLEAATKFGYKARPNAKKSQAEELAGILNIGVMISHPSGFQGDPSSAGQDLLAGLSDAAAKKDVNLAIHFVPPTEAQSILDPLKQPAAMRAGQLSGLILLYPFPEEVVTALSKLLPCVSIVHHHPDLRVDCIDSNQLQSVARLVEHLHGLGHRRFGFVSWGRGVSWERRRFEGFLLGLLRCGSTCDSDHVLNLDAPSLPVDELADIVAAATLNGVTAWVCAADHVGYGLTRKLRDRGLVVGRDLAMTGFDGMRPPPDCPALTTMRVPFEAMGYAALRRLVHRINEPAALVRDVVLRCDFVEGATSCPPPSPAE